MSNEETRNEAELPKYKCHKEVRALKILDIHAPPLTGDPGSDCSGNLVVEAPYGPVEISSDYYSRHKPEVGGYYVVYEDGYKSYSPAKAFEDGYTLITKKES